MTKLTNAEKDKLDNTCGNLRVTKLGTHVKSLEDFVNEGALATRANDVTSAINELYGMIVNNECADIQIPPPGFFTIFGNDEDGKLYVYYNDEEHPPVFRHVETEGELEGTLYLYIADPEGENHYEMEIGHYIAVKHLENYFTKQEIIDGYAIKNHAVNASTYGLGSTSKFGHVKTINGLTQASHADGLALSAYQGKVLKTAVDEKVVTVEKQSTAESGYSATYIVKQNNAQVGVKINIPKDFLVKSTSVKTCTTANQPVNGYEVGDIYIDWVVNSKDNTATDEHLYLRAKDIGSYPPDEVTLTIVNNQFKIKDGGVGSTQLASDSVLTAKIKDANVTTAKIKDGNVTTAKIKDGNVTTAKLADSNVTTAKLADGAVTNDKVTSITKNKISDFSHAHGNLQNDGKVGTTDNANKNVVTDGNGKITTEAKPVVVDAVEEGNINAVSSNAVYDYVGDVSKEIPVKTYQQFISLIARAEDGDVIVLDADYNFSKTGLTYYLVGIGKSLTIFGNGHRIFTENDEDTYFILRSGIDNKTTIAFYDTIFTNLKSDEFLFATDNQYWPYSELIFDNCMFINNSAKGICDGALGDYSNNPGEADHEAKVTIRNCTFKNNKTTYGTLFFKYDSSVINSIFTANSASTTGYGGAIHRVSGNVSVVDCEFNTTTDTVVGVTPTDSIQQKIDTSIAGKIDTAGAGLTKEGTTLKHSNSVTAQTSAVLKKIKYDAQGHITGVGNVGKSDITALGIPGQDTTYSTATQSDNGLMSSTDKTKLDGIATGANKITVDSSLSSTSTNPVQNKVINTALSGKASTDTATQSTNGLMSSTDKTKLDGIATGANKITVDSALSTTSTNPVQNKVINTSLGNKVDKVSGKGLSTNDFTDDLKTKLDKSMVVGFANAGGTTSAYTATITGVTLTHGTLIALYNAVGANAASATLNVNSLGAKPIYYNASAIGAGRYPNKAVCLFMYNTSIVSTGCWQLIYSYDSNNTYTAATLKDPNAHSEIINTAVNAYQTAINSALDAAIKDVDEKCNDIVAGDIDLSSTHTHTKSQITDFPTSMTPTSHSHGSLANGGTLNSDISSVNKIAVTDSSNNLKTISKLPADKVTHQDISGKLDTAGTGLSKSGTTLNHSNSVTAQTSAVLKKIKYDAQGHITGVGNVGKSDITALDIASTDVVSQSTNGLMSSTDKTKLDGIAEGANAYTHPSGTSKTGNPTANQTPAFGGSFKVTQFTSNATGHITAATDRTITIPSSVATSSANGLMSSTDKGKMDKSMVVGFANAGGTTSAYTATITGVTLTHGTLIALYNAVGANAASATLNVNSLGAKPIYYNASAIGAGRYPNKAVCLFMYNTSIVSTGCWQLIYSYDSNTTYTSSTLKDPTAHTEYINTAANVTQTTINSALDSAIYDLAESKSAVTSINGEVLDFNEDESIGAFNAIIIDNTVMILTLYNVLLGKARVALTFSDSDVNDAIMYGSANVTIERWLRSLQLNSLMRGLFDVGQQGDRLVYTGIAGVVAQGVSLIIPFIQM